MYVWIATIVTVGMVLSKGFAAIDGMAREHRIPLVRIRCMSWEQYQKLRKIWKGRGLAPATADPIKKRPEKCS